MSTFVATSSPAALSACAPSIIAVPSHKPSTQALTITSGSHVPLQQRVNTDINRSSPLKRVSWSIFHHPRPAVLPLTPQDTMFSPRCFTGEITYDINQANEQNRRSPWRVLEDETESESSDPDERSVLADGLWMVDFKEKRRLRALKKEQEKQCY